MFGTLAAIVAALALSLVSTKVNTVFVERHHGTDRNRNRRRIRKTYGFSKDWAVHEAMTWFTMYSYNFCWASADVTSGSVRGTVRGTHAGNGSRVGRPCLDNQGVGDLPSDNPRGIRLTRAGSRQAR